ncbi:MAG TPA: hypothetical protein VGF28_24265 [Thermoanaerobaculia bacterium]|jgi:hypothetical protein
MSAVRCEREDELLDALGRGFVGAELEAHAGACTACSELRLVAGALLDDRSAAMAEAPLPAAGTMWWRMRLRRRQELEARARHTLLIGQAMTVAAAAALAIAFFGADLAVAVREIVATIRVSTPLLIVAAFVLATPIAGWAVIRQK